ncbi:methyl-accepting chemotaxis protein [Bacterioplanes sanyensis]|nr:methyl-accepting chemotaxis protein [Bacterioplanes sanyensis]
MLGLVGGGAILALSAITYVLYKGTLFCRVTFAIALVAMFAINVQQAHGIGEGHFLFFINFAVLSRYCDAAPVLAQVGATVVHHLSFTWCQTNDIELLNTPVYIFSWETESLGILAPLLYHVGVAVIGLAVSCYLIYQGNKRFFESSEVQVLLERVASGDLSARSLNTAGSHLLDEANQLFATINTALEKTANTAQYLSDEAEKSVRISNELSTDASNQRSQTEYVANSISQMRMATDDIAKNAEATAAEVANTVAISDRGKELSSSTQSSLEQLISEVKTATEAIDKLEDNSAKVSNIISVIRSISEQTNLLALNAAIEAARAGEQGRGFAVVADEVRVLSQKTHDSTEEISSVIETFQVNTDAAVACMKRCMDLSDQTSQNSLSASDNFASLANGIRDISDMASQIATAAEQQSNLGAEISDSSQSIRDVTERFMSESMKSQEQSQELQELSAKLNDILKRFSF